MSMAPRRARPRLPEPRRIMLRSALRFACTALLVIVSLITFSADAQQFTPARDGLTVASNGLTLEVTALRKDVLRVRVWKGDAAPEDASWAVLPSSRISRVRVASEAQRTAGSWGPLFWTWRQSRVHSTAQAKPWSPFFGSRVPFSVPFRAVWCSADSFGKYMNRNNLSSIQL